MGSIRLYSGRAGVPVFDGGLAKYWALANVLVVIGFLF